MSPLDINNNNTPDIAQVASVIDENTGDQDSSSATYAESVLAGMKPPDDRDGLDPAALIANIRERTSVRDRNQKPTELFPSRVMKKREKPPVTEKPARPRVEVKFLSKDGTARVLHADAFSSQFSWTRADSKKTGLVLEEKAVADGFIPPESTAWTALAGQVVKDRREAALAAGKAAPSESGLACEMDPNAFRSQWHLVFGADLPDEDVADDETVDSPTLQLAIEKLRAKKVLNGLPVGPQRLVSPKKA